MKEVAVLELGSLGTRITDLRERRGWTQKKLSEEARLSVTFLSEVENGKRNIGSESLLRIADALGASLDFLLRGTEDQPQPRESLKVPPELALAADEQGWTFGRTADLLRTRQVVIARRSEGGSDASSATWSKEDWVRFHERVFDDE